MACCDNGFRRYLIPPFWGFTDFVPTVPKLYWNVRSQEQRILNFYELMNKVICYADYLGENVDELKKQVDELEEKINDPEFYEFLIDLLQQWIDAHMPEIIGKAARIVYFGLTLEGYFAAYIPQGNAWDDVMFDTGANYDDDKYGRLMLYYMTDNSNSTVWQD